MNLVSKKLVNSVHDVSSGGILVALSEMCISGSIGAIIKSPRNDIGLNEYFFGEDQSRYIIEVKEENIKELIKILKESSVYFEEIGTTQNKNLEVDKEFKINLSELSLLNKYWFNNYFKDNI